MEKNCWNNIPPDDDDKKHQASSRKLEQKTWNIKLMMT